MCFSFYICILLCSVLFCVRALFPFANVRCVSRRNLGLHIVQENDGTKQKSRKLCNKEYDINIIMISLRGIT